jgi:hypothetical protein
MQPPGYGGGQAELSRLENDRTPREMRADRDRWAEDHPKATAMVARLYAEDRQ